MISFKKKKDHPRPKTLGTLMILLTCGIFIIMFFVMTLQGVLMYTIFKLLIGKQGRLPHLIPPVPLLITLSTSVGVVLTLLLTRIPLKPIRELIDAINELAQGNFKVRVHLNLTREFILLSESFNRMAQELENTELLRSDFINNFSHEFKTPIVSLRGFARLLKNGDLTKQERDEYLDIIIDESSRLSQLATNVLNLSRIEKLEILSDLETFSLTEEIRQAILLLESRWQAKNIELIIDMDELTYHASRNLLGQVWINLIDNAIKFSPEKGKIKIKLHKKDGQTIFRIMDNGCGMEEEALSHVFDRFYQADPSHTTEGNGIGLTIVQKIVALHKGDIKIESEAGIGTNVTVTLP